MNKSKLFKSESDWWHNACLHFTNNEWDIYALGYKEVADNFISHIIANDEIASTLDTVIFPIIFLYRHYLELRFKQILILCNTITNQEAAILPSHNLKLLWNSSKSELTKVISNFDVLSHDMKHIDEIVNEFSLIDSTSTSFRYPIDTKGNKNLETVSHINFRTICEKMDQLVLEGIVDMLYDYIDALGEEMLENLHNSFY